MATFEETIELAVQVAVKRAVEDAVPSAVKKLSAETVSQTKTEVLAAVYPVGSYFISENDVNPSTFLGGTWVKKGQGRCLWGADDTHAAGTAIAAGLPDITGTFAWAMMSKNQYIDVATGAFYKVSDRSNERCRSGGGITGFLGGFAASRSNSIYGRSSTVQPPALAVNIWVRTA